MGEDNSHSYVNTFKLNRLVKSLNYSTVYGVEVWKSKRDVVQHTVELFAVYVVLQFEPDNEQLARPILYTLRITVCAIPLTLPTKTLISIAK